MIGLAVKSIKNNKAMCAVVAFQITAIFVIAFISVSSVCSRYTYYNMFRDYFSEKKALMWDSTFGISIPIPLPAYLEGYEEYFKEAIEDNNLMGDMTDSAEMSEIFPEATKAVGIHNVWANIDKGDMYFRSLDSEIIEKFSPQLENGRWMSARGDKIEAVITQNDYGIKAGDCITVNFLRSKFIEPSEGKELTMDNFKTEDVPVKVEVTGVLEDGAYIPGRYGGGYSQDYRDFYTVYNLEYEEEPVILFSYETLKKIGYVIQPLSMGIVCFDEETPEERMEGIKMELSKNLALHYTDMEIIHDKSMKYIYRQMYILIPVIASAFILSCISIISLSAVTVKDELRNYAVFAICGLEWGKCIAINVISSALLVVCSAATAALLIGAAVLTGISGNMVLIFNGYTFTFTAFFGILFTGVSAIMPALLIRRMTPKQVITKE